MDKNMQTVRKALLERNFFKDDETNGELSLSILNSETSLQNIVIEIEQACNCSDYKFQYNKEKDRFIRLNKEENFVCNEKCEKCYRNEYSIEEFIELCKIAFEPFSVRTA